MLFIAPAILNRASLNGLMPNNAKQLMTSTDTVTPSEAAARAADMARNLSDTVTVTDADVTKAVGLNPAETVKLTDWTFQKKSQQDFTGE